MVVTYPNGDTKNVNANLTVLQVYTVTFDSAGGSAVANQQVTDGNTATKPADPTKQYAEFVEWVDESDNAFDFDTAIIQDMTLTAKWNEYTMPTAKDQTVKVGDEVTPESFIGNADEMPAGTTFAFQGAVDTSMPGTKQITIVVTYPNGDIKTLVANMTVNAEDEVKPPAEDNSKPPITGNGTGNKAGLGESSSDSDYLQKIDKSTDVGAGDASKNKDIASIDLYNSPKTGDDANSTLYAGLAVISMLGLIVVGAIKRRNAN